MGDTGLMGRDEHRETRTGQPDDNDNSPMLHIFGIGEEEEKRCTTVQVTSYQVRS